MVGNDQGYSSVKAVSQGSYLTIVLDENRTPQGIWGGTTLHVNYITNIVLKLRLCEVGATERGCSGSIGSDDTRGYGAGSGDVGKELPRGIIP